jgi:plasmid stabilization system protein ParE
MSEPYRVNLTAEALADLRAIYEYVSIDSPQNAAELVERILDTADSLNLMPDRFKRVGRSRSSGSPVHAVVMRPFIIYYQINHGPPAVSVLTIRHGGRRQPRTFR